MKTLRHIVCLFLLGLVSSNIFASNLGNGSDGSANLNSKISNLLANYEDESPVGGVALLNYTVDEAGVITVNSVEASNEQISKYVYKHLNGLKLKHLSNSVAGTHTMKLMFE